MNEEQTVLDFFSQEENLPLALIAAEHLDSIRFAHNNRFWRAMHERLNTMLAQNSLPWNCILTEDRNASDTLLGLHLEPHFSYRCFLRPFMEQQLSGDSYRIYYGLMWNIAAEPAKKSLAEVNALRVLLSKLGFKDNETFLAWQWSPWYPRRKDFLLRFSNRQEELLHETMRPWQLLLQEYGDDLNSANKALSNAPHIATISLDQLHIK